MVRAGDADEQNGSYKKCVSKMEKKASSGRPLLLLRLNGTFSNLFILYLSYLSYVRHANV